MLSAAGQTNSRLIGDQRFSVPDASTKPCCLSFFPASSFECSSVASTGVRRSLLQAAVVPVGQDVEFGILSRNTGTLIQQCRILLHVQGSCMYQNDIGPREPDIGAL